VALAYVNKAAALANLNRWDEALEASEKAIQLDSNLALAYYNKAVVLRSLERFDEALEPSEKAIQLDPSLTEILHQK
jgi:tetratricopeptide (TPR) repeat protein